RTHVRSVSGHIAWDPDRRMLGGPVRRRAMRGEVGVAFAHAGAKDLVGSPVRPPARQSEVRSTAQVPLSNAARRRLTIARVERTHALCSMARFARIGGLSNCPADRLGRFQMRGGQ